MGVGELSSKASSSSAIDLHLKKSLEVLLFVHDKPIDEQAFLQVLDNKKWTLDDVRHTLEQLARELILAGKPYSLEKIGGGWVLQTHPEYDNLIKKLIEVHKKDALSKAQLETLAVIAYSQPITRIDIESVRGVTCAPVLKVLQEKDFVRIVGKADKLGAPVLYGTTRAFLDAFGLGELSELPEKEEIAKTLKDKLHSSKKLNSDKQQHAEEN